MARPYVARAEIQMTAPIDLIWSINLDLAKYTEWNPFIVRVTNIPPKLVVGSELTLHVEFANGTRTTSHEVVTDLSPPSFADATPFSQPVGATHTDDLLRAVFAYKYSGLIPSVGIINGTRYQWLEQRVGSAMTVYRTEEEFTGPGAAFVPLAQVQDGFQRHAVALRDRAEAYSGN